MCNAALIGRSGTGRAVGTLLAVLAGLAAPGCGGDQGPQEITVSIRGHITSDEASPRPVAGARVALRQFLRDEPVASTATGADGSYRLQTTCDPEFPELQAWVEVSAAGYWLLSSYAPQADGFSDPPIRCVAEPQVIDFALPKPPTLRISGTIAAAGPGGAPIAGASVRLVMFYQGVTAASTTTDGAGHYQLTYTLRDAQPCDSTVDIALVIEASADGYLTTTTESQDPDRTFVSDPPIYCTRDPQVVNLLLPAEGASSAH